MSAQHEALCAMTVCQPMVSSQASAKVGVVAPSPLTPALDASARGVFESMAQALGVDPSQSPRGVFESMAQALGVASARGVFEEWGDDWLDEVISQMPDDICRLT